MGYSLITQHDYTPVTTEETSGTVTRLNVSTVYTTSTPAIVETKPHSKMEYGSSVYTTSTPAIVETARHVAYIADTPVQRAALDLYDRGFNIGPTKPGLKMPYLWRGLLGTRIDRLAIPQLFYHSGLFVLCGRLSLNLAIIDADDLHTAAQHAAEFQIRGLKPWIVNTARGQHFWILCADGELSKVEGDGWQLWGSNHYCLVPPSVHDTGLIYEWAAREGDLPPTISMNQLDWIPDLKLRAAKRTKPDQAFDVSPLDCLSRSTRDFISNGAPELTRNTRLFSAACDLHGNEFHMGDAIDLLSPAAVKAGLPYREVTTTIKSAYATQRTPAKRKQSAPPLPTWGRALAWAQQHHWQKLHALTPATQKPISCVAQTARAVFLALVERSRRDAADVFRASRREVAELANVDQSTADRCVICLMAAGLILARGYTSNGARLVAFSPEVLRHAPSNTNWSRISGSKCNTHSEVYADVFRRDALGKTAETIWRVMLPPNTPARKAEIARRAGCDRSTVTRVLSPDGLPKWGLASEIKPGLWIGNPADERYLGEVAVKSGTAGRAAARKMKHATERTTFVTGQILKAKQRWDRAHEVTR